MLSCCMISWCEAKTIDLSLKSLNGLIDEVIVADTGSFDGTVKIAREWIDKLNFSGQVLKVKAKTLGQARIASWKKCSGDWILLIDSNFVLSNKLKKNIHKHLRTRAGTGHVPSLNLMGDYEHYFTALPFHATHSTVFQKDTMKWPDDRDRPEAHGTANAVINGSAVNLSRVRPAWRYWYRGEQFNPKYYIKGRWNNEANLQYQWGMKRKYYSLVDYIKAERSLSLEDVKRIAPKWYLEQLQKYARPLDQNMVEGLPEVIKEEQRNPRYRLIKEGGKIVGRWPEL